GWPIFTLKFCMVKLILSWMKKYGANFAAVRIGAAMYHDPRRRSPTRIEASRQRHRGDDDYLHGFPH
ncbi:MAG: hypothetical protein ACXW48_14270, partial [Candidatus Binatia bacterium]